VYTFPLEEKNVGMWGKNQNYKGNLADCELLAHFSKHPGGSNAYDAD
jgi:hypothetical protein